jgi:hypothetical protein
LLNKKFIFQPIRKPCRNGPKAKGKTGYFISHPLSLGVFAACFILNAWSELICFSVTFKNITGSFG